MNDERCETCRFWLRGSKDGYTGYCRRNPPQLCFAKDPTVFESTASSVLYSVTFFPATHSSDWCGEYRWATT